MATELPGLIMCVCTGKCPGFAKMDIWDFINRVRMELPLNHPSVAGTDNKSYVSGLTWKPVTGGDE